MAPRVTAVYGINGSLIVDQTNEAGQPLGTIEETHQGISLGIGQQWAYGANRRHSWDLDLIVIASSTLFDRIDELSNEYLEIDEPVRVNISFGYRYNF